MSANNLSLCNAEEKIFSIGSGSPLHIQYVDFNNKTSYYWSGDRGTGPVGSTWDCRYPAELESEMAAMLAAYRTGIEGEIHVAFKTEGEQSAYEKGLDEKYRPIMGDYVVNSWIRFVRDKSYVPTNDSHFFKIANFLGDLPTQWKEHAKSRAAWLKENGYLAKAKEFSAFAS